MTDDRVSTKKGTELMMEKINQNLAYTLLTYTKVESPQWRIGGGRVFKKHLNKNNAGIY